MSRISPLLFAAALLLAAAELRAADLSLALHGGALGAPLEVRLEGTPGLPYLVLFDSQEQKTPVAPGVELDVSLSFATIAAQVPGFLGALDAAGLREIVVPLPPDPALDPLTITLQAVGGVPPQVVSNRVRLTPAPHDRFEPTLGAPPLPLLGGSPVALPDGRLLFAAATGPVSLAYDPDLETWDVAGAAPPPLPLGASTVLADGRLLVTGGVGPDGQPTDAAFLFDPGTLSFEILHMTAPRAGHRATRLDDGRVLITGGFANLDLTDPLALFAGLQASTELFDPALGAFLPGPQMLEPRALHSATLASDGRVLVAGGFTLLPIVNLPTVSQTAYRYDPKTNSFGLPSLFSGPRLLHTGVALDNGRVLLVGGLGVDLSGVLQTGDWTQVQIASLDDAQLFVPTFFGGLFQSVPGLDPPRAGVSAARLEDGSVLLAGGFSLDVAASGISFTLFADAQRYAAKQFLPADAMDTARAFALAQPLPDGTVLVAGGGATSSEIYQP